MSDVDVAAIRAALDDATGSPWCVDGRWDLRGHDQHDSDRPVDVARVFDTTDAELIVLLRNNAEALLDAAEKWLRYSEVFQVQPAASSLRPMRTTSELAEPDWSNGVHP